MKPIVFIVFLFLLLGAFPSRTASLDFDAKGVLKQYSGTNLAATFQFRVSVRDCNWFIRTTPDGTAIAYFDNSYDGEYTYYYVQLKGKSPKSVNSSVAIVQTNNIPYINSEFSTA